MFTGDEVRQRTTEAYDIPGKLNTSSPKASTCMQKETCVLVATWDEDTSAPHFGTVNIPELVGTTSKKLTTFTDIPHGGHINASTRKTLNI